MSNVEAKKMESRVFLHQADIGRLVSQASFALSRWSQHENVLLLGVLDACFQFYTDLVQATTSQQRLYSVLETGFVNAKSYSNLEDTGLDFLTGPEGRAFPVLDHSKKPPVSVQMVTPVPSQIMLSSIVILVDTILDTGDTLCKITSELGLPQERTGCITLIHRGNQRRVPEFSSRFNPSLVFEGMAIPGDMGFVVGYGLDLNRRYRQLPDIYEISSVDDPAVS